MTRTLRWSIIALFAIFLILFINLSTGTTKAAADIDWIDVAGEGGTSILMAVWWWVLLAARPAGKVSNFIISGIFLLFLGSLQDTLDEFVNTLAYGFSLPDAESIMMPLGMFLLTLGLLFWKEEQKVIDNLLLSREGYFRDHRTVDSLTHLADIRYLKNNITMAFERSKNSQQPLTLLLIDLDDFHSINRRFGFKEG
ncbi:MAG: diguanylate cyclase, partial [Cellvibrionaceae bacterium]|nr:diguanylate cyclase [Cellvibrionaceae bacterium]